MNSTPYLVQIVRVGFMNVSEVHFATFPEALEAAKADPERARIINEDCCDYAPDGSTDGLTDEEIDACNAAGVSA
jgi:hypothetical protein